MGAPTVVDDRLVFAIADPDHRLRQVQLACDDDLVADHRFRRTVDGWTLAVPRPPVQRLEYRLLVTDGDGDAAVVLDPGNPSTVATVFGHRSVAHLPEYREPAWRTAPGLAATRTNHEVDTAVGTVPVTTWSPADLPDTSAAPLLVVHDGPEYDRLADLGTWASALAASGRVPRFRMALLQPVARDEWYAVNPDWPASVATIVCDLARARAVAGPLVVMGASLGGLAALQVALADTDEHDDHDDDHAGDDRPLRVGGVLSQSGSFFLPHLDPQEATHPGFDRISSWVATTGTRAAAHPRLDIALTCGTHEENHDNNLAMVEALAAAGHRTSFAPLADLHNYTAWRDGLAPSLDDLVTRQWGDAA